jgi:hypothetical protein
MARPRIFVSSTYYDLKHIRASLEAFIDSVGYEAVLFESGDISFRHDQPLDESCYQEIRNCHMLVLIVGGRYGSPTSDTPKKTPVELDEVYKRFNSITRKEYETARERDVPIFIFVDKNVLAEYQTFKKNRDNSNISYAYVDSVNIFFLLDDVLAQRRNNFIRGFEKFDDISMWLRDQWAGLFADFLVRAKSDSVLTDLGAQIGDLRQVTSVLKEYSEAIIQKIKPDNFENIISEQQQKLRQIEIKRFFQEDFIFFLHAELLRTKKVAPSPTRFFEIFVTSSSLEDFMRKLGITEEFVRDFTIEANEPAEREYSRLVDKYTREEPETDS